MWSSMMGPQSLPLLSVKRIKTQQNRDFGVGTLPCDPMMFPKSFKNLNFVNKIDKYQSQPRPVESSSYHNMKNSCQRPHIIDSIKEKCPEVIPSGVEGVKQQEPTSNTHLDKNMYNVNTSEMHKSKGLKRKSKMSRQNMRQQEITEIMQAEKPQDISNESRDITFSPKLHSLILNDFISQKPIPTPHIDIPLTKNSIEMLVTIRSSSPLPRSRKYSITDSEDSFIVFDEAEDHEEDNGGFDGCTSPHLPKASSFCESEDSFVMFEQNDEDNEEDDESFDGESNTDSESSWNDDSEAQSISDYDEVDFCRGADISKKVGM
ncbi:uncharacterized protein PPP1R15 isoform X2 [Euwallacea similis]|uniref:uncharacterized protein PPP1R15 isoform X2 n=1 Tax=Euwallacea similis TaxID=1736056 RepID=UPI00344EEABE